MILICLAVKNEKNQNNFHKNSSVTIHKKINLENAKHKKDRGHFVQFKITKTIIIHACLLAGSQHSHGS